MTNKIIIHKVRTERPWGSYTVLEQGKGFKVKIVEVLPNNRLSLQKHQHRSEHWVVVEGQAKIITAGSLRLKRAFDKCNQQN